jgi:hypothetical protein
MPIAAIRVVTITTNITTTITTTRPAATTQITIIAKEPQTVPQEATWDYVGV